MLKTTFLPVCSIVLASVLPLSSPLSFCVRLLAMLSFRLVRASFPVVFVFYNAYTNSQVVFFAFVFVSFAFSYSSFSVFLVARQAAVITAPVLGLAFEETWAWPSLCGPKWKERKDKGKRENEKEQANRKERTEKRESKIKQK